MKIVLSFFIFASFAFSHKLNLFLTQEDNRVYASAYFATGSFCKNCEIRVKNKEGEILQSGKTNREGEFIITKLASWIYVEVKTPEGHAAKSELSINEIRNKKEENTKELNELKKEIERLKSQNKLLQEKVDQNEIFKMIFALFIIAGIFFILKRIKK